MTKYCCLERLQEFLSSKFEFVVPLYRLLLTSYMASEVKESTLTASTSQASSLGHMMEDAMTLADAGEGASNAPTVEDNSTAGAPQAVVGEKRPPPKAGLFDAPAAGSKRQKQSRYIVVDGHAVLKDNNYGITQGYISVFDGGEFQTGAEAAKGGGADDGSKDFYINAAGEVSKELCCTFCTTRV